VTNSSAGSYSEVTCFVGEPDHGRVRAAPFAEALRALEEPKKRVWINLLAPDKQRLGEVCAKLGFHELAVEDVFSHRSRVKIEEYKGHLFCISAALNRNPGAEELDIINLNAFLGPNYLITAERAPLPVVALVARDMGGGEPPLLRGADFVLYRLLDGIVDEYTDGADRVSTQLDEIEECIFARFDPTISSRIFTLKHQTAWARRRIAPQRNIIATLTHHPHELIRPETQVYFRDVEDHIGRIADNLDTFHDLLQGALDVYLSLAAGRTNQQMKLLSVMGAVMLPMNMLIGLYGTNFIVLPGSDHPRGFWFFCGLVASVGVTAAFLFRMRRWF
jgi:magnesium transporter